jgi:hypothetical protein
VSAIAKLRAMLEAASPGPWEAGEHYADGMLYAANGDPLADLLGIDARLIATMRNVMGEMLEALEAYGELDKLSVPDDQCDTMAEYRTKLADRSVVVDRIDTALRRLEEKLT